MEIAETYLVQQVLRRRLPGGRRLQDRIVTQLLWAWGSPSGHPEAPCRLDRQGIRVSIPETHLHARSNAVWNTWKHQLPVPKHGKIDIKLKLKLYGELLPV